MYLEFGYDELRLVELAGVLVDLRHVHGLVRGEMRERPTLVGAEQDQLGVLLAVFVEPDLGHKITELGRENAAPVEQSVAQRGYGAAL